MNAPSLDALRASGLVTALDGRAASAWARIGGETREAVLAAAALASRAVAAGHTCLELGRVDALLAAAMDGAEAPAIDWPDAGVWREALRASPLVHDVEAARVAAAGAVRPLVVDGADRLYLRRYWDHQERLAAAIRARVDGPDEPLDEALLAAGLARLFPELPAASEPEAPSEMSATPELPLAPELPLTYGPAPEAASGDPDGPDLQRAAAEGALRSRFFVISGGPGTGKTSTVAKILALLVEQGLARESRAPRILLLAPTGKAAARLQESIGRSLATLDCTDAVRAAIPDEATTVHRGLGAFGTPMRFRYDARRRLEADVVLLDEASMVDLALMARLAAALPDAARLILLGDRDQLASVEAGAVLADLASPPERGGRSCFVELTRSYRFDAESGVGELVRAVHAGDAERVLAILGDPARPDVARIEPGDEDALAAEIDAGYAAFAAAGSPEARLEALGRYRVLCAHRRGPGSVEALGALIAARLERAGAIAPRDEWYAGRPVGVTRNDYALGLYNGDVGVVAARPDDDGRLGVLFRDAAGAARWVSPPRLGAAETVFAMSVHKSQGSELDEALIVLPEAPSPVVTRELLYTAVSRARSGVRILASEGTLRAALARRVVRASGLRDAIWAGSGPA